jgi:predicted DNA-binding transcriptional regulator YafY
MHALIIEAISARRLLRIDYEPGPRIIEPCAYGEGSDGQVLLRAFQTSGASASGEHAYWKLFREDRIVAINLLADHFAGPRPGYRRNDKAMTRGIYCQL